MATQEIVVLPRLPTLEELIAEIDEARQVALEERLPGVMLQCTALKGKFVGFGITTRHEILTQHQSMARMDAEQVLEILEREQGREAVRAAQHYFRMLEKKNSAT